MRRRLLTESCIEKQRREREHHLAEDVVLTMPGCRISHAHGLLTRETGPERKGPLAQIRSAIDAVQRCQIEIRCRGRDVQKVLRELLALLEAPEQSECAQRVERVAQPAI